MKSLQEYFFEDVNKDKASLLIDFIKQSQKENDEDADKAINKLYDTFVKINGNGENFELIKSWISEKMKNDGNIDHTKIFQKSVFSACEKYSCYEQISNLAKEQNKNNKDAFLNIDFEETTTKLKFDDICNYFKKFDIPEGFFNSLFKSEGAGQPVIGKGEYVLRLVSSAPDKDTKGGDVIINKKPIEVKNLITNEANLGNNKKGSVNLIFNFLNEFVEDKITPQTISLGTKVIDSKENTIKIKKAINEISNKDINELVKIFKNHINDFYFEGKIKNTFDEVIEATIKELQKLNNISNFKDLIKIFTALYVIMYCVEENAQYLCMINKDKVFNFLEVNNDVKTFENILSDKEFPFYQIRYSSGKYFVQIKYGKK